MLPTIFNMDIKLFNTKGALFDESEFGLLELPPISDEVIDIITEAGGKTGDKPNVRIVSGLDPDITEFIGGREWRVYAFREHKHKSFFIYQRSGKQPQILTEKEAEVIAKSNKTDGILVPQVDTHVIEHGIPRYFVEMYRPPEYFGTPEAWNEIRYEKDENDNWFDLMGEFPYEGRYETWFCIEDAVLNDDGEVVCTRFKEIDDVVLSLILQKIEAVRENTESLVEQHKKMLKEGQEEKQKEIQKAKENVRDIVAEHADRLVGTIKTTVPTSYDRN